MSKKDYYEVLGVNKNATEDQIKKAYRSLAKEFHPDKNPDNDSAKNLFQEIQEAYETLSDKNKRANYDQFGHNYQQFGGNSGFTYQRPIRTGKQIRLTLKLTLEELYTGVKKTLKYKRDGKCTTCNTNGGTDGQNCNGCGGSGVKLHVFQTPFGNIQQAVQCDECQGNGLLFKNKCGDCNGNGVKEVEQTIEIEIPAGVPEGANYLYREGGNAIKSGEYGDLIISIIELQHKTFKRTSNGDLTMSLKLTYSQLVLGDKVEIETIDGSKIRVTIPEHSDVDTNLRVQGKGITPYQSNQRGDLIINLGINIPKQISEKAKELLESLKDLI